MNAPTTRTAVKATAITMGLHTLCTVAMVIPALLAPVAAADFGTDASRVGVLVALIYVGVVPAGLACGLILATGRLARLLTPVAGRMGGFGSPGATRRRR